MPFQVDGALYPDAPVPDELTRLGERVDFLARLCAAWDFGLLPDRQTVEEIPEWREAVDATRLLTSPVYLVRRWHGLPRLPYLGQQLAYIRDDPSLEHVRARRRSFVFAVAPLVPTVAPGDGDRIHGDLFRCRGCFCRARLGSGEIGTTSTDPTAASLQSTTRPLERAR